MHNRLSPVSNRFVYNIFMFYLDLDELTELNNKFALIGYNKSTLFNFRDSDHLRFPLEKPETSISTKAHIVNYLKQNGVEFNNGKIMLLTHLRTFGYVFNPVSFYYCFDESNNPIACIAEVSNTFKEMKPYFLGKAQFFIDKFEKREKKYFYVSPFIDLDAEFEFSLKVPGEKLNIRIDDLKGDDRFFISTLTGKSVSITNARLFWYAVRYPFITLKVISLIHLQAVKLWAVKRLSFFRKNDRPDLQRDVFKKNF